MLFTLHLVMGLKLKKFLFQFQSTFTLFLLKRLSCFSERKILLSHCYSRKRTSSTHCHWQGKVKNQHQFTDVSSPSSSSSFNSSCCTSTSFIHRWLHFCKKKRKRCLFTLLKSEKEKTFLFLFYKIFLNINLT